MTLNRQTKIRLGRLSFVLFFIFALEVIVRSGLISVLILSSPSRVALAVWQDLKGTELWSSLETTAVEFGIAFLISLTVGVLLGVLFFRFRPLGSAVEPLLLAFYAAPTILLYPLFLTLFGLGSAAVVALASVFGSVPIMVNVRVGLAEVQPIFVKLGRSLKATQWQTFWKIMVPAATPTIFTGLRLGLTYTLVAIIAVEFITFSGGLGKMVSWRYFIFDTEGLFSGIFFVIVIAVLINHLLRRAEERIRRRWT